VEEKVKAIIALSKSTYNKSVILAILSWMLGDEYNTHKDKKVASCSHLPPKK
jgi:hypothetical protein